MSLLVTGSFCTNGSAGSGEIIIFSQGTSGSTERREKRRSESILEELVPERPHALCRDQGMGTGGVRSAGAGNRSINTER